MDGPTRRRNVDSIVFLSTSSQKRIRDTRGSFEIINRGYMGYQEG